MYEPIDVPRDATDGQLQAATQAIADALGAMVADGPEQWYTFKPMWPATQREAAELERRAQATAVR
jgi:lauroyl/myristoyl acyltransferase